MKKSIVKKKHNKKAAIIFVITLGLVGAYLFGSSYAAQYTQESKTVCLGVSINPGDSIQDAIGDNSSGTVFCLKAGTHTLNQKIDPKAGNTFWGENGAIISGAKNLTSWVKDVDTWSLGGALPADYTEGFAPCEDESINICKKAEWVFVDDERLNRVNVLSSLVPGSFYSDYGANKIYLADDPTGKKVELSYQRAAMASAAANITIKNLIIEKFAALSQRAAIESSNGATATNWVIEDSEFRNNHGAGALVFSNGAIVINNTFHHNGQTGLAVYKSDNVTIDNNEIYNNNTDGFWVNDGENGGIKITRSTYATVTNNYVHDNNGLGIWFDIDNKYAVVSDNYISNNASDGLRYEISFDADISNNTLVKNGLDRGRGECGCLGGGGALTVNTSMNVSVHNNTFYDNDNTVAVIKANRGNSITYGTAWDLQNLKVYSNTFTILGGQHGLVQYVGDNTYYTNKGNSFYDNSYHLASLGDSYFFWQNAIRTKDQWVSYGQDTAGTFDTVIPPTPLPPTNTNANNSDLNNDTKVDIVDLSILLSNWGTNNTTADINSDGIVDIVDLSILLSDWS